MGKSSSFIEAFWALRFTTQKNYLYHHSSNHHHHHVIIPHIYPLFCNKPIRDKLKKKESSFTVLSHISCVLKQSGTYIRVDGFLRTVELHFPSVLYSSGTIHKNPGFHSTAVSHAACDPRASFIGWKKKLAILFDLSRSDKCQILWSFTLLTLLLRFTAKI